MIKRDFYMQRLDGVNLYRSFSDRNMIIRQRPTGVEYSDASATNWAALAGRFQIKGVTS